MEVEEQVVVVEEVTTGKKTCFYFLNNLIGIALHCIALIVSSIHQIFIHLQTLELINSINSINQYQLLL